MDPIFELIQCRDSGIQTISYGSRHLALQALEEAETREPRKFQYNLRLNGRLLNMKWPLTAQRVKDTLLPPKTKT